MDVVPDQENTISFGKLIGAFDPYCNEGIILKVSFNDFGG